MKTQNTHFLSLGMTLAAGLLLTACSKEPAQPEGSMASTKDLETKQSTMQDAVAVTSLGKLQGEWLEDKGVVVFKGVHYGQSTAGKNRFLPPQPAASWEGIKDATQFGDVCPQGGEVGRLTTSGKMLDTSEDCLVLNVWAPVTETKDKPVMVWFHGRGFYAGSGSEPLYDGANLANRGDLIVVTVNHRLNVFGYLELGDIGGEAFANSGNAGVLDMELALEWVRDNISAFGGNPNNVTIFGESGGGVKVATLLGTPSAKDLFQRGIIQSGARPTAIPKGYAIASRNKVMEKLNVTTVEELQALPMETLLSAVANPVRTNPNFGPVKDGRYIPRDMFVPDSAPSAVGKPIMVGSNRDEYSIYERSNPNFGRMTQDELKQKLARTTGDKYDEVIDAYSTTRNTTNPWDLYVGVQSSRFHRGTDALASVHSTAGPTYLYSFDFPANEKLGAHHGAEIAFVFSNATDDPNAREGAEVVQDVVSEAWISFARDGNPNHPGMPEWPTYNIETRRGMVFDVESKVVEDIRKLEREVWLAD